MKQWTCLLCKADFEPQKWRSLVCEQCRKKALELPPQLLTPAERLWGKCYEKDQCWEFGTPRPDGRAYPVMIDKRQRPAAQVALFLSGQRQPSPDHIARARCGNKLCVNPEHIEWVERLPGSPFKWGQTLTPEDMASLYQAHRDARAKYQRDYRANLKRYGVRTMADVAARRLVEVAHREVEALREAPGVVVQDVPEPPPLAIVPPLAPPAAAAPVAPPAVRQEPKPPRAPSFLSSLAGAKIAPPD